MASSGERVQCHACNSNAAAPVTTGELRCPICNSEFVERITSPAPSVPQTPSTGGMPPIFPMMGQPQHIHRNMRRPDGSSVELHITTGTTMMPAGTGHIPLTMMPGMAMGPTWPAGPGGGHTQAVMFSMPLDVAMDGGFGGIFGGLGMGDGAGDGGTDNFDAMLTRILNAYQPPSRPTSAAVLESLPRLKVQPPAEAEGKAGVQPPEPQSEASTSTSTNITSTTSASASSTLPAAAGPAAAASAPAAPAGFATCRAGEPCSVCHDHFSEHEEVVELPCSHCFHEECLMPWLQEHNTCPMCRYKLHEENPDEHNTSSPHLPRPLLPLGTDHNWGHSPRTRLPNRTFAESIAFGSMPVWGQAPREHSIAWPAAPSEGRVPWSSGRPHEEDSEDLPARIRRRLDLPPLARRVGGPGTRAGGGSAYAAATGVLDGRPGAHSGRGEGAYRGRTRGVRVAERRGLYSTPAYTTPRFAMPESATARSAQQRDTSTSTTQAPAPAASAAAMPAPVSAAERIAAAAISSPAVRQEVASTLPSLRSDSGDSDNDSGTDYEDMQDYDDDDEVDDDEDDYDEDEDDEDDDEMTSSESEDRSGAGRAPAHAAAELPWGLGPGSAIHIPLASHAGLTTQLVHDQVDYEPSPMWPREHERITLTSRIMAPHRVPVGTSGARAGIAALDPTPPATQSAAARRQAAATAAAARSARTAAAAAASTRPDSRRGSTSSANPSQSPWAAAFAASMPTLVSTIPGAPSSRGGATRPVSVAATATASNPRARVSSPSPGTASGGPAHQGPSVSRLATASGPGHMPPSGTAHVSSGPDQRVELPPTATPGPQLVLSSSIERMGSNGRLSRGHVDSMFLQDLTHGISRASAGNGTDSTTGRPAATDRSNSGSSMLARGFLGRPASQSGTAQASRTTSANATSNSSSPARAASVPAPEPVAQNQPTTTRRSTASPTPPLTTSPSQGSALARGFLAPRPLSANTTSSASPNAAKASVSKAKPTGSASQSGGASGTRDAALGAHPAGRSQSAGSSVSLASSIVGCCSSNGDGGSIAGTQAPVTTTHVEEQTVASATGNTVVSERRAAAAPLPAPGLFSPPGLTIPITLPASAVQHTIRMLQRAASGEELESAVYDAVQNMAATARRSSSGANAADGSANNNTSSSHHSDDGDPSPLPLLLNSLTALSRYPRSSAGETAEQRAAAAALAAALPAAASVAPLAAAGSPTLSRRMPLPAPATPAGGDSGPEAAHGLQRGVVGSAPPPSSIVNHWVGSEEEDHGRRAVRGGDGLFPPSTGQQEGVVRDASAAACTGNGEAQASPADQASGLSPEGSEGRHRARRVTSGSGARVRVVRPGGTRRSHQRPDPIGVATPFMVPSPPGHDAAAARTGNSADVGAGVPRGARRGGGAGFVGGVVTAPVRWLGSMFRGRRPDDAAEGP